jgi:hypothetical protein
VSALWTNDGLDQLLQFTCGTAVDSSRRLMLWVNNYTPVFTTVYADLTECALSGYARVNLNALTFAHSAAGGIATANFPLITFTFDPYVGGPVTIYGYAVIRNATDVVYWLERRDVPYVVPNAGGSLPILLNLTERKLP